MFGKTTLAIALFSALTLYQTGDKDTGSRRHSIRSNLLLVGDIRDSIRFMQLNYSYLLTPEDN